MWYPCIVIVEVSSKPYLIFAISGQFYWYNTSKEMDCEQVFPIYLTYSKGILYSFGWTFKGYFEDPRFDHPSPTLAAVG